MKKFSLKRLPSIKSPWLQNPILLYLVMFLSAVNLIGYVRMRKPLYVICFLAVGYGIFLYSKNKLIALLSAILVTNMLLPAFLPRGYMEGMENKDSAATSSGDAASNTDQKKKVDEAKEKAKEVRAARENTGSVETETSETPEPLKSGSIKEGSKKPRIDYASTVKDAYKNLTDMLGPEGIKGLTKDTKELVKEQSKLTDAMNNMAPLLDNAKSLLGKMDMGNLNDMMKKFGGA
jgi:hypothetical protein